MSLTLLSFTKLFPFNLLLFPSIAPPPTTPLIPCFFPLKTSCNNESWAKISLTYMIHHPQWHYSGWIKFGKMSNLDEIGNVAQLTGVNAIGLIGLIVKTANSARLHKKNCRKFANHLKLIGNLLEKLKITELKKYPETSEPLEQLEDALRRAYVLVHSCQEKSYLYLLAMGWSIATQFKRSQDEIDRYLKIMPLLSLVSNARFKERLERIERDRYEYTLDEEDRKMQVAIMNQEPSKANTILLKRTLSCSYPNLCFEQALQQEREKLHVELHRSQSNMKPDQCQVIQRLIEVTETAVRNSKRMESSFSDSYDGKEFTSDVSSSKRNSSVGSAKRSLEHSKGSDDMEEWHTDLLDCCTEPSLCARTFFFPCGTFSRIASVATNRHMCLGGSAGCGL